MHEAGIAASLAATIRREPSPDGVWRVTVSGGRTGPDAFDAALRQHLAAELGAWQGPAIEIVHEPCERLCSACAWAFLAYGPVADCPSCGAPALPLVGHERIELEWRPAPRPPDRAATGHTPTER